MTSRLRFGVVSESVLAGPAWLDHARRIEDAGVGVLLLRDHFSAAAYGQQFAPFSALAAAAAVTARLHVGTLVLANDFRHPVIVAHEAASLHQLSGGRFELGLGAGWYRPEYEAAGLAFQPARQRIDRLEESLAIISGLLAGAQVDQAGTFYQVTGLGLDVLPPLQGRPRLVVGAGGPRMLGVAGRYADTVGLLPAPIKSAEDRDDPLDLLPAALDQKIAVLRDRAGDRFPALELSTFVTIWITSQRRQGHRGTHRPARLERDRRQRGLGDADHPHRQRGPDQGGPAGQARAVRAVLPRHPGPGPACPHQDHR